MLTAATALLAKYVGEKAARPIFWAIVALLLVAIGATLTRCNDRDDAAVAQIDQTKKSADAAHDAAVAAIDAIGKRHVTETDIDVAVTAATGEIDNAQTIDDVRNSVIASVCNNPAHSGDPACNVR
jgi:glutamate dehydrogenase/leucine dehydrogenase